MRSRARNDNITLLCFLLSSTWRPAFPLKILTTDDYDYDYDYDYDCDDEVKIT